MIRNLCDIHQFLFTQSILWVFSFWIELLVSWSLPYYFSLNLTKIIDRALSISDPAERMLQLTRWVMSGHHTRPKGVKKPFNPIIGEFFRCEWKETDDSTGFYICEQVSHHPPQSAFFYANPTNKVWILGNLKPHARFLGNSAGTMMEGGSSIYLGDEIDEFHLTNPNVYARSILFGKMFMELGDSCTIKSKKHNTESHIEFKQKVAFSSHFFILNIGIFRRLG